MQNVKNTPMKLTDRYKKITIEEVEESKIHIKNL